MSQNGCLLAGIIERHSLIVGNGTSKCNGAITRRRRTKNRVEKSVIDILMFSSDLNTHFMSMHIDEQRRHVLTRIRKTKQGVKVKESDHNVLLSEFKCKVKPSEGKYDFELYNLKNKESYLIIPFQTVVTFRIATAGMSNVMAGHLFTGPAYIKGPTLFRCLCTDRVKE